MKNPFARVSKNLPEAVVFVDPGTYSAGWAAFSPAGEYLDSGTVRAYGKNISDRLGQVGYGYSALCQKYQVKKIVLERMNGRVNYYLHWVSGAIIMAFNLVGKVNDVTFCTPGQWKQYLKMFGLITTPVTQTCASEELDKVRELFQCDSTDELVAVVMGHRHFSIRPPERKGKANATAA